MWNAENGRGTTANISSSGLLFYADRPLPVGKLIRVSLIWPLNRAKNLGLKLVLVGHIRRADDCKVAVEVLRYEFHTRRTWSRRNGVRLSAKNRTLANSA